MTKFLAGISRIFYCELPQKVCSARADGLKIYSAGARSFCGISFGEYYAILCFVILFLIIYSVVYAGDASDHFYYREFACRCCGEVRVDAELLVRLERLRVLAGNRQIIITSGYRCPVHNARIGGARRSQHMLGKAADIQIRGLSPAEVAHLASKCGFSYIEPVRYTPTWTHVDVRSRND